MNKKVSQHVNNFLVAVDPLGSMVKLAQSIAEWAEKEEGAADTLDIFVSKFGEQRENLRQQIADSGAQSTYSIGTAETQLLVIAYLRARDGLAAAGTARTNALDLSIEDLASIHRVFDIIESDFLYHVLLESEMRARRVPAMLAKLKEGEKELNWLTGQLSIMAGITDLVSKRPDGYTGIAFASKDGRSDGDTIIFAILVVVIIWGIIQGTKNKVD